MSPQDPQAPMSPAVQIPQFQDTMPAQLGALQSGFGAADKALDTAAQGVNTAAGAETKAVNQGIQAEQARNDALLPVQRDIQTYMQRGAQQRAELAATAQAQTQSQMSKIADMSRQFASDAANQGGFWADKGVGSKIGWAVAMALGGFGSAMTHTPNGALQLFEQAMADDARTKERKLGAQKDAIQMERNSLADMRALGLDAQQARDANYIAGLDIFKQRLQVTLAQTQNPIIQANGQKALAEIDQKRADKIAELSKGVATANIERGKSIAGTLSADDHLKAAQAEFEYKQAVGTAGGNALHVAGFSPAGNQNDYEKLRDMYTGARGQVHGAEEMMNLLGRTDASGKFHPYSKIDLAKDLFMQRRLDQLAAQIGADGARMLGRAVTAEDVKLVLREIGLPLDSDGHVNMQGMANLVAAPEILRNRLKDFQSTAKTKIMDFANATGQTPMVKDPFDDEQLSKLDPTVYVRTRGGK